MTLSPHPAAELFPMLDGPELDALAADIRQHGQRDPIVLFDGKILDGRNRARACEIARVEPRTVEWRGSDPIAFVVSTNLHRRHLNESQRGMVAARVKAMFEEGAKERQREAGGDRRAVRANLPEAVPSSPAPRPRDQAAALLNVSPRTVQAADKVASCGSPELVRAVEQGKVAVSTAAVLSSAPKAEQTAIVACGEKEILRAAKEIKAVKAEAKAKAKAAVAEKIASEPAPMPEGPYRVLVLDPPWRYGNRAEDPTHRAVCPYPDMSIEEICELPVASLAHDDAVLWLWTTNAFMREAFQCLDAWGFHEKTILTWAKDRMGCGDWLRGRTEHCILAVRGKPLVTLTNQTTLLHGPVREHSRKPDEFYQMVEALCPGSKVELFARQARPGWALWGAEAGKFNG